MTDKYPGLSFYTDRHGKVRWRYRTKERVVSLPAPDQPGFKEAYQAAVEGRKAPKAPVVRMPGAALPGTFGAATQRLKVSVKWLAHDEATRRKNTRLIDEFLDLRVVPDNSLTWRDVPVKNLRRAHVEELLGRFIATPHKAKHLLVAIRKLVYVGLRQDWIETDPTASVEWRPAPIPAGRRGLATQWNNLSGAGQSALPRARATGLLFGLAIVEAMSQACDGTSA
ncbi:hypothetical protein [Mesorhizobium sp.]|uniref:hypothetical protein n=1 Tax=Mesorhizobium sp. TaxID=1871066 RepID=UPI00257F4834|nr:hypothetical protein [Mesorhizobium sp.]